MAINRRARLLSRPSHGIMADIAAAAAFKRDQSAAEQKAAELREKLAQPA